MEFKYIARNKQGEVQMGVVSSASEEAAADVLQKTGLYVTHLESFVQERSVYTRNIRIFGSISRKEIVLFARQLSVLVNSNVPLTEALTTLSAQIQNPDFREKILEVSHDIESGIPFSQALAKHQKIFSSFFISLVKSGEASGKLSEVLSYLAEHMERDYYLTSKIRGAMTYPIFVLGTIALVMTVMVVFVMPQLIGVLTESGVELPVVTRILISIIEFIRVWGWLIFVVAFSGIGAFVWWMKTPKGKIFYDETSIKVPVLGNLTKSVSLSRFAENLSTLISGGIPIAEALEITADIVGNSVYKNIIMKTRDGVRRGESISSLLSQYPNEIPPVFTQMTTVGEKTGKLDSILANVADFYRKEVDVFINNSLGLIEPVLMVVLGLVVGFFVISFLLPLYQGMSNL